MYATHRRSSVVPLAVLAAVMVSLGLVGLTDASGSTLTVKILHPPTDPYETPSNRFVTFCAAAYDSEGQDVSEKAAFAWEFGDRAKSEDNPTNHQYEPGEYKVIVTATLEDARGEAGLTVIVGKPEPLPDGGRAALLRIAPPEMPAGKVCDQPLVECVQALPAPDAIWCNFYYKAPGEEEFTGHSGGDAWNTEWGGFKYYGMADWHSCIDHNDVVADGEWKAELYVWWEEEPTWVGPAAWGIDNTIIKAEDDCGAQYAGVLAYDPEGDAPTISWTLSHLDFHTVNDPDPPFNVRLKIYKPDGTLVFTYDMADERLSDYTDSLTWQGWQGGYNDWDWPLPETPGPAPKGIYTYRMWAVHDLEGIWDPSFWAIEFGPPAHECKDSELGL